MFNYTAAWILRLLGSKCPNYTKTYLNSAPKGAIHRQGRGRGVNVPCRALGCAGAASQKLSGVLPVTGNKDRQPGATRSISENHQLGLVGAGRRESSCRGRKMQGNHQQKGYKWPHMYFGEIFFAQFVGKLPSAALITNQIASRVSEQDIWCDTAPHIQYLSWGN